MALRDQPYLPLYVQDYLSDEKLNLCSPQTQGVYIKMMCIFHKSDVYGGILLNQKDKQKESNRLNFACKFGKLLPFKSDIIEAAIDELLDEKVLHLDGDFLYQKRMVHDNEVSLKRSISGKLGGNKSLGNKDKKRSKNLLKQKSKQNTEYEYENENKDVDVIGGNGGDKIEIYSFDDFWNDYDKKVGDKTKLKKKWELLSKDKKLKIKEHIPKYKVSRPEKKFRKDPDTYLNNSSWNDEIITDNGNNKTSNRTGKIDPNDKSIFC